MATSALLQTGRSTRPLLSGLVERLTDPETQSFYVAVAFCTLDGFLLLGPEPDGVLFGFLRRGGQIKLVVGIDAITTASALQLFRDLTAGFPGQVEARIWDSSPGTLFHPKLFMFESASGNGSVFLGSNNLTTGGLVGNTELAVRLELETAEFAAWLDVFGALRLASPWVRELRDEDVTQVAARRRREVTVLRTAMRAIGEPREALVAAELEVVETSLRVLLQTVPRSGDRLSQVGIAAQDMRRFFGLQPEQQRVVRLQQLQPGGLPQRIEVRSLVRSPVNRNSRIEVGGLGGQMYPTAGRPVLVFQETGVENYYRYMLLMPGDPGFLELTRYLESVPSPGLALSHTITNVESLQEVWPDYPL